MSLVRMSDQTGPKAVNDWDSPCELPSINV